MRNQIWLFFPDQKSSWNPELKINQLIYEKRKSMCIVSRLSEMSCKYASGRRCSFWWRFCWWASYRDFDRDGLGPVSAMQGAFLQKSVHRRKIDRTCRECRLAQTGWQAGWRVPLEAETETELKDQTRGQRDVEWFKATTDKTEHLLQTHKLPFSFNYQLFINIINNQIKYSRERSILRPAPRGSEPGWGQFF